MTGWDPLQSDSPNTWPAKLRQSLEAADGAPRPSYTYAIGGTGVAIWSSFHIPYALASLAARIPERSDPGFPVLINLGVNDLGFASQQSGSIPLNQTTWQNQYLTIVDAIHAQYPDAIIYIAKPWKRGFNGWCDTLAAWTLNVVAARSFTREGIDERVVLKGSDDGATNTSDGIHPNEAGQIATAAAWFSVIHP